MGSHHARWGRTAGTRDLNFGGSRLAFIVQLFNKMKGGGGRDCGTKGV